MSAEKTKALVRRLLDEMNNQGNIAIIDELVAPDFFEHEAPPPGIPRDREGVKTVFTMYHSAFSAIQATIDDMIAEDDKVVSFMTVRATHTGEFAGIPATGKQVDVQVIDMFRVAGGQVKEHWGISDRLTMLQQLGVIPTEVSAIN
ncbi:MAG: ester cyclase [Roseiflexaceae bacterium]